MRLGAQLYTVREFTQTAEALDKTLQRVAAIGYRFVQCSALGPIPAAEVKALLDKHGLTCVITHDNPERILTDTRGVIADHRTLDCPAIGMGLMPERYRFTREGVERFAADYAPAIREIGAAGMSFHYHNHDLEFTRVGRGETLLDVLLSRLPTCGLIFCAFWAQVGGANPIDVIRRYGARIQAIHLKDMAFRGPAPIGQGRVMTPVMEGNMNYAAIVAACAENGVGDLLVEQDTCDGDPFDCLAVSYRNLATLPELRK